jgi:ABC-type arginine transport system permease subunit
MSIQEIPMGRRETGASVNTSRRLLSHYRAKSQQIALPGLGNCFGVAQRRSIGIGGGWSQDIMYQSSRTSLNMTVYFYMAAAIICEFAHASYGLL